MNEIYKAHPVMYRARPFTFIVCVLLIPAFGIGILFLLIWYLKTQATVLTVTKRDLLYERGILSRDRLAMSLRHVRSVEVKQSFMNRILGVGTIAIWTAGDQAEFMVSDLPDPHEVREAISQAQEMRLDDQAGSREHG